MSLFDEILPKLKPYVLGWIQDLQQASTVGAHELSGILHTGQLADSQAPQFLKLDGTRTLIGNLPVTDGITVDGVDISAHAGNVNAHHNQVHTLAGGDHTASGLTVGHVLRANGATTFAWAQLGHGDLGGVTANQHHNQVHAITGADHTVTGNQYDVVGLSATNTLGVLTSSDNPGANVRLLRSTSAGGLQLNLIDVAELQTDEVSSHLIPKLTDTYDLGSSTKLWRKGWLSELEAVLFVENTIQLLGGWFWVPKDAGTLPSDITAVQTTVDFGKAMTVGNFVIFRASLAVEYMTIGSLVSGTTYNVTRNVDGSGANAWPAGAPFAVLGASGDGRIELNAYDTPRVQLIKQGATYNAQTELIRIGDLNGGWGYAAAKWGIAIGEYASGKPNITIDEDGVMRFRTYTTDVMNFSGGNADITGKLRMPGTSSAIAIGSTPPTGAAAGTGIWIDRTGLFSLVSGSYRIKIDATDGKLYAGGGKLTIDNQGIVIDAASASVSTGYIRWMNGANEAFRIGRYTDLGTPYADIVAFDTDLLIYAGDSGTPKNILFYSGISQAVKINTSLDLSVQGGLYVGDYTGDPPTDCIIADLDGRFGGGLFVGRTTINPPDDDIIVDGGISYSGNSTDPGAGEVIFTSGYFSSHNSVLLPAAKFSHDPYNNTTSPAYPFAGAFPYSGTIVWWASIYFVATTNNGSNYWTIYLKKLDGTTIASFNTSAASANTWTWYRPSALSEAINSSSDKGYYIEVSKTGSPGAISLYAPAIYFK